jgi:hypothetical protein
MMDSPPKSSTLDSPRLSGAVARDFCIGVALQAYCMTQTHREQQAPSMLTNATGPSLMHRHPIIRGV